MFNFPENSVFAETGPDLTKSLAKAQTADRRKIADMEWSNFDKPLLSLGENAPGFLRFQAASSTFRHPAFKAGTLYAIPTQDANKPVDVVTGIITITPDPLTPPSQDETRRLKIDAINEDLEIRGLLGDSRVMGRFQSPVTPKSYRVAEEPVKREDDEHSGRFVILIDGEFAGIRAIGPDHDKDAVKNLWGEVVAELGTPTVDDVIHHRERKVEMVMVAGEVTAGLKRHVETIEYEYTASIYDTSVEPSGWFVFGIPVDHSESS